MTQKNSEEPIGDDSMLHEREPMTRSLSMPVGTGRAGSISSKGTSNGHIKDVIPRSKRYAKTLRLTSDQLVSKSVHDCNYNCTKDAYDVNWSVFYS